VKAAVIQFPGSNCDRDATLALQSVGIASSLVWHGETEIGRADLVVLPGGFSYGDHLRSGAIAAHSPVMAAVSAHARRGGLVLGICNGFQILTEAGLLEGALLRNQGLHFLCRTVWLRAEGGVASPLTAGLEPGAVFSLPIAHNEGCYYADPEVLDRLEGEGQVALRYCDPAGGSGPLSNPNGSARSIAGLLNRAGNVFGLMPHPERACEPLLGSTSGYPLLAGIAQWALP
jgi:phosphoribosylformylglycinamidine synthase